MNILECAKARLEYNPTTGELTSKIQRAMMPIGSVAGTVLSTGYRQVSIHSKYYYAHRVAWLITYGRWPHGQIDHINGLRDDNRLENLREVTSAENAQNLRRSHLDNKTGLLGVSKARGKFLAQITTNGKHKFIGYFKTAKDAHEAYLAEKRDLHQISVKGAT